MPFLGAGANLCDRPPGAAWEPGRFLPSGAELARALAERSRYPDKKESNLLRISQYVDAILGEGQLYRYLHALLDADYPPSSLHRLLARVTVRADGVARLESEGVCGLARGDGLAETARRFLRSLSSEERRRLEENE